MTTQKNIKKNKIRNLDDVLKSKYPLVTFSNKMQKFDKKIKIFFEKNVLSQKVKSNTTDGKIIKKLFLSISKIQ